MGLWKRVNCGEMGSGPPPSYLEPGDVFYYAYDYVSGGNFREDPGNHMIGNFQKDVSLRGTPQWKHKAPAIQHVGEILAALIRDGMHVAAMPTSKSVDDPEYDDRLIQGINAAKVIRPALVVHSPISRPITGEKAKHGTGSRHPDIVINELEWLGFEGTPPATLLLFDDVITTGGHFKACMRLAHRHHPTMTIAGVFCARTMWPDPVPEFEVIPVEPSPASPLPLP